MGCCTSQENSEEAQRKIAVVGDSGVGKTSLIQRLMTDDFDENTPQEYIASALKVDEKLIELKKGKKVRLFIYDTGGQETFKHLRKLNYPKSDAVIICFSVDNIESLQNVKKNWVPEMQRLCPGIPMLLVGNKVDIRHESESIKNFVPRGKGENTAKKNKMVGYIECSAKTDEKVKDVFEKIAQVALQRKVIRKEETA
ncbi:ras-like GTP-binding protein rhoA [Biomphalaria glabrata]|uniref:Ras-like GTP-binding protein rhoA n=1 Tax=Biomphalaria glabrata TaxID=6526 RepID=A0A2C9K7Q3_BIOGL|nr:ras-like GTP-binding protein rhoA [Biomphalaria glabrata]KAI8757386.1 ras-like GTP-binding protein rhoA [Biomphalaria glabrata]KAI8798874.1 ras GTP-binding protein rhoA [Biomphalaria glabrata]